MSTRAPETRHVAFPAARYEALRSIALGTATAAAHARGLALFMRHGMAAWMRAWRNCGAQARGREDEARDARPVVPAEMVAVLTEMAWAAAREEVVI